MKAVDATNGGTVHIRQQYCLIVFQPSEIDRHKMSVVTAWCLCFHLFTVIRECANQLELFLPGRGG